ncbi:MAG: hypothetical protein ACUVYA_07485 [Planctomycetota bacterium]
MDAVYLAADRRAGERICIERIRAEVTTEYLEGRSLRAWIEESLKADRGLPLGEAARILEGIPAVLREAERSGVVHRQPRPQRMRGSPAIRTSRDSGSRSWSSRSGGRWDRRSG